jgi:hypothetical protein
MAVPQVLLLAARTATNVLLPLHDAGTYSIPGAFGCGKTVVSQALSLAWRCQPMPVLLRLLTILFLVAAAAAAAAALPFLQAPAPFPVLLVAARLSSVRRCPSTPTVTASSTWDAG